MIRGHLEICRFAAPATVPAPAAATSLEGVEGSRSRNQASQEARPTPRNGAAGSTAGKAGAGVAAAPGAVAAAGAAARPLKPEAGPAPIPKKAPE